MGKSITKIRYNKIALDILLDILPEVLDISQKKNKIKNMHQFIKNVINIRTEGKFWKMSKLIIIDIF